MTRPRRSRCLSTQDLKSVLNTFWVIHNGRLTRVTGDTFLKSVLGAADAEPSQTKGNHKDTGHIIHIFEICPRHSRRRAISIQLFSYRYRGCHIFQRSVLGAANAEASQIRVTEFLGPLPMTHKGNGDLTGIFSCRRCSGLTGLVCCLLLHTKHCYFPKIFCIFMKANCRVEIHSGFHRPGSPRRSIVSIAALTRRQAKF